MGGYLYLAAGTVNLKGINGGVLLYKRTSYIANTSVTFSNAVGDINFTDDNFIQPGDWHCVQFVDVNNDGFLDVSALSVNGPLVILFYDTTVPQYLFTLTSFSPSYFAFQNKTEYSALGATMAWGDIDGDSDLDVYINNNKYIIIYKNFLEVEEDPLNYFKFTGDNLEEIKNNNYDVTSTPDYLQCKEAFSSAFGWYSPDGSTRKLALALGSSTINTAVDQFDQSSFIPATGIGSTAGISVYSLTSGADPDLEFNWAENQQQFNDYEIYFSHNFQLDSDIQWANTEDPNCQDIISAGYGILKRPSDVWKQYIRSETSVDFERERGAIKKFTQTAGSGFDNGAVFASAGDFYSASSFTFFDLTNPISSPEMVEYNWIANTDLYKGDGSHPSLEADRI